LLANKWQIRRTRKDAAFDAELRGRLDEKTGQDLSDEEWGAAKMLTLMILFGLPEKLGIPQKKEKSTDE
jgi:hypothetical protein